MTVKNPSIGLPAAAAWPFNARRPSGRRLLLAVAPLLLPLAALLLWQAACVEGLVSPQILPRPGQVLATFVDLLRGGDIADNLAVSLRRIAIGFAIGVPAGLLVGGLMGLSDLVDQIVGPSVRALAQVPTLGWIPILMLIVGLDESLKYIIIAKACFVPTTLSTAQGLRDIPRNYRDVARVLRLRRSTLLLRLWLPAALPSLFSGLRLALGSAWIALVVVEMLAATEGIGYMMVWGRTLFQLDIVLVGMILIGLIGFCIDLVLMRIEKRLDRVPRHG